MTSSTASHLPLSRRLLAELLGTGLLVAVVVGSGIMAARLSPDDTGLQLLQNSTATAFGLAVLIVVLGPTSGAHFNPVVSIVDAVLGRSDRSGLSATELGGYIGAQVIGAVAGAVLANLMFQVPTAIATTERVDAGRLLAEVVATAGLVLVIVALSRSGRSAAIAPAVGAYIGAAYWFTSSTSFANPAVTIGRMLSDTFAGIAPASVLPFIAAQLVGGAAGAAIAVLLHPRATTVVDAPRPTASAVSA
ncbi:aquaporin [Agrococcus beijingensis]|uniref:aquaporin n=1 Tax=Agrococcus beijingensis TaxID=3068634 RepID=UPI0027411CF9|nr:MIP/aquaporin family protein [Agrococcus sp. REN33]